MAEEENNDESQQPEKEAAPLQPESQAGNSDFDLSDSEDAAQEDAQQAGEEARYNELAQRQAQHQQFTREQQQRLMAALKPLQLQKGVLEGDLSKISRRMQDADFGWVAFFFILIVSSLKDFADIISVGLFGTSVNFFVLPILVVYFWWRKRSCKNAEDAENNFGTKGLRALLGTGTFEFFPVVSFLPTYTLMICYLKFKVSASQVAVIKKDKNSKTAEIKALDGQMEKIVASVRS